MGEEALKSGDTVVWQYMPRGGYEFVSPVNGVVALAVVVDLPLSLSLDPIR